MRWIVGISGASGTVYARRLLQVLATERSDIQIELIISDGAYRVFKDEDGLDFSGKAETIEKITGGKAPQITLHNCRDTGASVASGSFLTEGMVVIPASMNTIAAIAHGLADNLLKRAADVTLKEGRRLIVVPRETPLNSIHLKNLLTLSEMGVRVVPAMPGFYSRPNDLSALIDHFVMRVIDQMGIEVKNLAPRWSDR
jgi:4-hydroxy-3-polyprenylbenzoate decarboxylase